MKILDMGDLMDCAERRGIETSDLMRAAEGIAAELAASIGAVLIDVSNQPGFGGMCATFKAENDSVICPDDIHASDPHGDWRGYEA